MLMMISNSCGVLWGWQNLFHCIFLFSIDPNLLLALFKKNFRAGKVHDRVPTPFLFLMELDIQFYVFRFIIIARNASKILFIINKNVNTWF